MRGWSVVGFVLALVVAAHITGQFFALACSESSNPEPRQQSTCDAIGGLWTATWWLAVLWPAALFVGVQFIPRLREYGIVAGVLVAILMVVFWVPLLSIVT